MSTFNGLFSEINLGSDKLGRKYEDRNASSAPSLASRSPKGLRNSLSDIDALGDAYEHLIGQFAAGSGKKAVSSIPPSRFLKFFSGIVTLDSQEPKTGTKDWMANVFDFACVPSRCSTCAIA